jgi:NADH-quinone oxidoreductase subunit J
MMLDVDFGKLRQGFANYMAIGGLVGLVLLVELVMIAMVIVQKGAVAGARLKVTQASNIRQIGEVLYTTYTYLFQAAGFVLLVAMIGAIVLTLRHRGAVKRQDIYQQVTRRRKDSVAVVKAKTGEGIEE